MKWPKTHGHFTHTNRTHARTLNTHEQNKRTKQTHKQNKNTHTARRSGKILTHTRFAGNCWGCRKLLELLVLPQAAGTAVRVSIETASSCWNGSRLRKLLELLLVHRSRPRMVAGTAHDPGTRYCVPRASIETASSCWNCLRSGSCSCVATVRSSDCCSCLWNPRW